MVRLFTKTRPRIASKGHFGKRLPAEKQGLPGGGGFLR